MTQQQTFPAPLPPGASPEAWAPLRFNEVEAFRRQDCRHYSLCLTYAAGMAWEGFTCVFCPLADAPPTPHIAPVRVYGNEGSMRVLEELTQLLKERKI